MTDTCRPRTIRASTSRSRHRPRRGAALLRRVPGLRRRALGRRLGRLRLPRPPDRRPPGRAAQMTDATSLVDGEQVPVRHFGVILGMPAWEALAARLRAAGVRFVIEALRALQGATGRGRRRCSSRTPSATRWSSRRSPTSTDSSPGTGDPLRVIITEFMDAPAVARLANAHDTLYAADLVDRPERLAGGDRDRRRADRAQPDAGERGPPWGRCAAQGRGPARRRPRQTSTSTRAGPGASTSSRPPGRMRWRSPST